MTIVWRWAEQDFGLRFRDQAKTEYYQGPVAHQFYIVPANIRKLDEENADLLMANAIRPMQVDVIANPWTDYDQEWDWITALDGAICLNYAGCLEREEIHRREDEGVARALEYVSRQVLREEPVSLTIELVRQVHVELMGVIYPFAGRWRLVELTKGTGPTKWPLPPAGMENEMNRIERDVFSRSPFLSVNDDEVIAYTSEVMNEVLALHPFREGNGRTAFIIGNLILMQNNLVPLTTYERRRDQERYFAACEQGRIHKNYQPLALLLAEWQAEASRDWEAKHRG